MESIHLKINTVYRFGSDEFEHYLEVAQLKIRAKIRAGLSISNIGFKGTSEEKEHMAIMAEVAFAHLCNIEIPSDNDLINNWFADFEILGSTIDVKSTKSHFPSIAIPIEKAMKRHADIFVLMQQKNYAFNFCGSIHESDLIQVENLRQPDGWKNKVYSSLLLKDLELPCSAKKQI